MFSEYFLDLSQNIVESYARAGLKLTTAESCTGGLVAALITSIPGSSAVFDRGFVTYSNEAKHEMLGVSLDLIGRVGAVSAEVAEAMCQGALEHGKADIAVSVTGIAGPGGATPAKPVGLVYIAVQRRGRAAQVSQNFFDGDRTEVREASVKLALQMLVEAEG